MSRITEPGGAGLDPGPSPAVPEEYAAVPPEELMIATCVENQPTALPKEPRGSFYTPASVFHISVGQQYVVVALGLFETVLLTLVSDDTGTPSWLPVGLFEFGPQALQSEWEFTVRDGAAASGGDASNRWVAVWGYRELVRNPHHSDDLIEGDPTALEIFREELAKAR